MKNILGADIILNLLFVFILSTGLLIMNANRPAVKESGQSQEGLMPKINLPRGEAPPAAPDPGKKMATISLIRKGTGIHYFIDGEPIQFEPIPAELRKKGVTATKIRCDESIPHGRFVEIMGACRQAGITEISISYIPQKRKEVE